MKQTYRLIELAENEIPKLWNLDELNHFLTNQNILFTFGDLAEELVDTIEFEKFMVNDQELILSALPIKSDTMEISSLKKLMRSSTWRFNYPIGLLTSSIVKPQNVQLHMISCRECKCSFAQIIESTLNSGLRQIFVSEVIEILEFNSEIFDHPVSREIQSTLSILENGLEIAIDGERYDPKNTGTNRVAVQLVEHLQKSEFTKSVTILIPAGQNAESVEIDSNILQIGINNSNLPNFDVLFRPYQSWEASWLFPNWDNFGVHIQWWLDFISFEIPEYAGGYGGITKNLAQAQWAFQNYESTLFLSPSCKKKVECLGDLSFIHNDVLPCTINTGLASPEGKREKIILVVGNSFNHKGRVLAIKVFEKLIMHDPEFRLVFIGGNPGFAFSNPLELNILEKNEILKSKVLDLGKVDDKILFDYYQKSMFLFAASTVEGFGLVPFEAANYGVVPLTSKIDAWEDYLDLDHWIDLYSIDKNVETILKLQESAVERRLQVSRFVDWAEANSWEFLSNRCLLHFAKTILKSNPDSHVRVDQKVNIKNLVKRSKLYPFLLPIWRKLKNV
jgi:glycosyltransferase involved in cell wall biosynthesis